MHLRQATLADILRLMEIRALVRENRLVTPGLVTVADYEWFVANGPTWVAETTAGPGARPHVVGFAAGDPRDGTVWALFVDPAAEAQGVGRRLLARVCETLAEQGHEEANLSTAPGTRAERFYRADGWAEVGRTRAGELRFRKRLIAGE